MPRDHDSEAEHNPLRMSAQGMSSSPNARKHKLSAAGNVFLWGLIVWVATQVPGVLLLKHNDWREDGLGLDRRSAAWSSGRQYRSELEDGLAILNQIEPRQVAYLRSRGNPILFIPCANWRRGYTSNPEGVVHICQQYRSDPVEIAAVLSHEIVHLERHDPDTRPSEHSFLRRFLGYTEEQEAHWQSLKTGSRLWPKHHSMWNLLGWQWFLEIYCRLWPTYLALLELPMAIAFGTYLDRRRIV